MRTIPNIGKELKQLDDVVRTEFIPAITGGINCSDLERKLLSFPPKLGGLGIPIFSETAEREYKFSTMISKDLTSRIVNQHRQHQSNENVNQIKNKVKLMKLQHHQEQLNELRRKFGDQQKRLNELNQEQGASSWLTTLPILDAGYDLTKQFFWDLIRVRYGWILTRLPTNCESGTKFDIQHALSCKKGGFISLRHNHLRNITATLLKEVCKDIRVEPQLQQLTGEILHTLQLLVMKQDWTYVQEVFGKQVRWHFLM